MSLETAFWMTKWNIWQRDWVNAVDIDSNVMRKCGDFTVRLSSNNRHRRRYSISDLLVNAKWKWLLLGLRCLRWPGHWGKFEFDSIGCPMSAPESATRSLRIFRRRRRKMDELTDWVQIHSIWWSESKCLLQTPFVQPLRRCLVYQMQFGVFFKFKQLE